jgi:hypothetical protein
MVCVFLCVAISIHACIGCLGHSFCDLAGQVNVVAENIIVMMAFDIVERRRLAQAASMPIGALAAGAHHQPHHPSPPVLPTHHPAAHQHAPVPQHPQQHGTQFPPQRMVPDTPYFPHKPSLEDDVGDVDMG